MNSIEEIRSTIANALKTAHNVAHSAVPINWPNFDLVDEEKLTGSYVSVEMSLVNKSEMFGIDDNTNLIIDGELLVSFLRPVGLGLTGSAAYTDMLLASLCNRQLSGIHYFGLRTLSVSPKPGIIGVLNLITFRV